MHGYFTQLNVWMLLPLNNQLYFQTWFIKKDNEEKYLKGERKRVIQFIFYLLSVFYSYATTSLTAILSKHFKVASDQQLTFAPGEIYKQLKFEIINDDDSKGNKTFQVIFSSPQRNVQVAGPKLVNISIMYAQGRRIKDTLLVNDDVSPALKST